MNTCSHLVAMFVLIEFPYKAILIMFFVSMY